MFQSFHRIWSSHGYYESFEQYSASITCILAPHSSTLMHSICDNVLLFWHMVRTLALCESVKRGNAEEEIKSIWKSNWTKSVILMHNLWFDFKSGTIFCITKMHSRKSKQLSIFGYVEFICSCHSASFVVSFFHKTAHLLINFIISWWNLLPPEITFVHRVKCVNNGFYYSNQKQETKDKVWKKATETSKHFSW